MPSFRYDQSINPWVARVWFNGSNYILGSYPSKHLAAEAEDKFRQDLRQITREANYLWNAKLAAALPPLTGGITYLPKPAKKGN